MVRGTVAARLVFMLGLLLPAAPAVALDDSDLFRPLLLKDGSYDEGWEQLIRFADGSMLAARFMITNLGPGSHRGIVIATLTTPDGRTYLVKNGRSRKDWQPLSGDRVIGIAHHRLERRGDGYRLYLRNSVAEIDLSLTTPEGWSPPTAHISDDRYRESFYYAPRLSASGRWRPGPASGADDNEPWRRLDGGRGFGLRYVSSTGSHDIASALLRFAGAGDGALQVNGDTLWARNEQRYESVNIAWDGRRLPAPTSLDLRVSRPDGGDRVPERIVFAAAGPGYRLEGELKLTRQLERFAVLENMDRLERFVIGAYSDPVQHRYLAEHRYTLVYEGNSHESSGSTLVEYVDLNPQTPVALANPPVSKDSWGKTPPETVRPAPNRAEVLRGPDRLAASASLPPAAIHKPVRPVRRSVTIV